MTDDPSILRELPHANGPEKAVLSVLMKYDDRRAETPLHPEIFYLPAHRTIYREMMAAGDSFELVTFVEGLQKRGHLDDIGGPAAITEIYTYAPNAAHFERQLGEVHDCHCRRMAIRAATEAIGAAFDRSGEDSAKNYLDALSGPITAIFDYAAGTEPEQDTKALAREFLADFQARLSGAETPMGISTGIPEIDQTLKGLHIGQMGVISGFPNGGKSTLGTQIAASLALDSVPALYLAYERGAMSVFRRSIIQAARVNAAVVNDPKANTPTKYDLMHIQDAVQRATPFLHVRTPKNRRSTTCLAEIRRYHRKHGVKVVFIDQIGLLRGERVKGASGEEELRLISNSIQEIAGELGLTVIVLCQTNAEGETKGARAIEEDADWWLSIIQERDKKKANFGEHQHILVAKDSHNGKAGERLELILDRETLRFVPGKPEKPEATRTSRFASR